MYTDDEGAGWMRTKGAERFVYRPKAEHGEGPGLEQLITAQGSGTQHTSRGGLGSHRRVVQLR